MELLREDGSVIVLKEGERHELGRGTGVDVQRDKSISRLHVIAELLRPASRKGKEVVGKYADVKLLVQVVGRNPICISTTSTQGEEHRKSPQIKFAGRGEMDWLAPGDKFALSIRRPLFFVLRQCSRGSLRGDGKSESQSAERTTNTKPVENDVNNPVEKSVLDLESNSLEEEEGIARAVARRQRRRLEREKMEQQRMRLSDQRQSQNDGLEISAQVEPGPESHEEASVVPRETNALSSVDPVSEFGFIVKGSEFRGYEKRSKTENGLAWNWKIDKKGETKEDSSEGEALDGKSKMNNRNSVENSRLEEEDEEWGGDNKEEKEQLSKATGPKAKTKVSTRSSRSTSSDQKRKNPQTLNPQLSSRSGRVSNDGEDLSGFLVEDDDSIEEADADDDEDEWMDDDEPVSHQTEKRIINREKQKPACKYGSTCYRTIDYRHPMKFQEE